jgi:cysteine desulfurase
MDSKRTVYLDNNATTRVAPEVIDAMQPFFREHWGNPSSAYGFGNSVARHVEKARMRVAELINADPREVFFTSCGSEGNNTAIHSAIVTQPEKRHIITTAVEHSATINYCKFLQKQGYTVTFMPVEPDGSMDLHLLEKKIRPDTAIVSVMWANNETGVLFPIEEIAAICRSRHVLCHTDAVQTPGKLNIDVKTLGVDFLSLSGHKLHAPKGIGLVYVKKRTKFVPYIMGGHQEHGYRAGTENVPYMVGFGRAAQLAVEHFGEENTRVRALRDRLEAGIFKSIPNVARNGAREPRLPNTANISFANTEAEAILLLLDRLGICVSSGSACTTGSIEPSHVLTAMDVKRPLAKGSIRFSLGRYNSDEDVDFVLEHLPGVIQKLRAVSTGKAETNGDAPKPTRRSTVPV